MNKTKSLTREEIVYDNTKPLNQGELQIIEVEYEEAKHLTIEFYVTSRAEQLIMDKNMNYPATKLVRELKRFI